MKKAFTLIEILVVATIIALLAAGAAISYTQLNIQSRDAKRKSDLEQIRAALEMYRSNNDYYPSTTNVNTDCGNTTGLSDATSTYLSDIPDDPRCNTYKYYYTALSNNGGSCDNITIYCTDYILAAHLETVSTTCQSLSNQCTSNCTYCLGPYGQK